jgi:hypothetical protein
MWQLLVDLSLDVRFMLISRVFQFSTVGDKDVKLTNQVSGAVVGGDADGATGGNEEVFGWSRHSATGEDFAVGR